MCIVVDMDELIENVTENTMSNSNYDPHKPVHMFNDLVSEHVQLAIAKLVVAQYKVASEACEDEFSRAEAADLLPHYRRARIESELCDLVETFPALRVDEAPNAKRNCHHRRILCNQVMLTESLVKQRSQLPREARFRQGYARSRQLHLFEKQLPPEPDSLLYAIVVHAPSSEDKASPAFVDVIFPDENYETILERIPLLEKFPAVIGSVTETAEEVILDNVTAQLRSKAKRASKHA